MLRTSMLLAVGALSLPLTATAASLPFQGDLHSVVAARIDGRTISLQNGLLSELEGPLAAPAKGVSASTAAMRFLKTQEDFLPGPVEKTLSVKEVDRSIPGLTHVIYGQLFKGVEVYDSHLVVTMKAEDQRVFRSWAKLLPVPAELDVRPVVSLSKAEAMARTYFGRSGAWLEDATRLVVMRDPQDESRFQLAWRVQLFEDLEGPVQHQVLLIDARSGALLTTEQRVWSAGSASVGSGVGLGGDTRVLQTWNNAGSFTLQDGSRPMFNATANTGWITTYGEPYSTSAKISTDVDNNWTDSIQAAAVDAHYFAGVVYQYYQTTFNRKSYDNKGANIISYVNKDMNNAYWSGSYMEYGDGDNVNFTNFAGGLSVIAHELTHAVTQTGANLKYQYQSGALNEALSDIMAKVEVDTDNWLIGDEIITAQFQTTYGVWALRDMEDPTFGGQYDPADPMGTMAQPDHHSVFAYLNNTVLQDYGGVHVNSGIINKMAQLMVDGGTHYNVAVSPIGRAKTAKLFYTINSASYLSTTADFDDFASAILKVATDLYGATSVEYKTVLQALQAIGLRSVSCATANEVESNNSSSKANAVPAGCTDVGGSISSSTDTDYFKLSLPAGKSLYTFLRVPSVVDLDLYLYKGSTLVTKSVHTGNGQDEQLAVQNTGTTAAAINLQVKRYNGTTGSSYKYTLNVKY